MSEPWHNNRAWRLQGRFWPTYDQRPDESIREWVKRLDSMPLEPDGVAPWTCLCEQPTPGRYGGCGTCLRMVEK